MIVAVQVVQKGSHKTRTLTLSQDKIVDEREFTRLPHFLREIIVRESGDLSLVYRPNEGGPEARIEVRIPAHDIAMLTLWHKDV